MYVYRGCGCSGFTRLCSGHPVSECLALLCSLQDLQELPVEMERFPVAGILGLERGARGVEWSGVVKTPQSEQLPNLSYTFLPKLRPSSLVVSLS